MRRGRPLDPPMPHRDGVIRINITDQDTQFLLIGNRNPADLLSRTMPPIVRPANKNMNSNKISRLIVMASYYTTGAKV